MTPITTDFPRVLGLPVSLVLLLALGASCQERKQLTEETSELSWSARPGCFERHLQRKYMSAFFPPESRLITQQEVDAARDRDLAEARSFREEAEEVVARISDLDDSVPAREFLAQLRQLDDLILRASELGGQVLDDQANLLRLYDIMFETARESLCEDKSLSPEFQELEEAVSSRRSLFLNAFTAQLTRPNTPIEAEDVIPALLTEDPETIRLVMKLMDNDKERQEAVKWSAIQLLIEVAAKDDEFPQLKEKLEALGARP